jgi:hypothetical protein
MLDPTVAKAAPAAIRLANISLLAVLPDVSSGRPALVTITLRLATGLSGAAFTTDDPNDDEEESPDAFLKGTTVPAIAIVATEEAILRSATFSTTDRRESQRAVSK